MTTIRTSIARIAAASAVVVSLGAGAASPALAQSGDIGSGPRRAAWTNVMPSPVTPPATGVDMRTAGGAFAVTFAAMSDAAITASADDGADMLVAASPDALILAAPDGQISSI
jgi:hypothetical protein